MIASSMKKGIAIVFVMISMISCSEETLVENPVQVEAMPSAEFVEEADVASLTVSGIFTEVSADVDCGSCTYKVPDTVRTVDGTELELKPGSVICVNAGRRLGEIEFVNMIGTENAPIIIGTCDGE